MSNFWDFLGDAIDDVTALAADTIPFGQTIKSGAESLGIDPSGLLGFGVDLLGSTNPDNSGSSYDTPNNWADMDYEARSLWCNANKSHLVGSALMRCNMLRPASSCLPGRIRNEFGTCVPDPTADIDNASSLFSQINLLKLSPLLLVGVAGVLLFFFIKK